MVKSVISLNMLELLSLSNQFNASLNYKFLGIALLASSIIFNPAQSTESQNKSLPSLIIKLVGFVNWPKEKITDQRKLRLCIKEDAATHTIRPLLLADNSLEQHFTVTIQKQSLAECQVVFIANHSEQDLTEILVKIKSLGPILTLSSGENYAKKGVMVNFYTEKDDLHFEINWKAMKAAKLNISSRVLKLARIVE